MSKRKLRKLIKEVIAEVSHVNLDGLPSRSEENAEGRLAEYEATFLPTAHDIRRIVAEELIKAGVGSYRLESSCTHCERRMQDDLTDRDLQRLSSGFSE